MLKFQRKATLDLVQICCKRSAHILLVERLNNIFLQFHFLLIAQLVKNLPAMQKTPVRFLGWEDLLEMG